MQQTTLSFMCSNVEAVMRIFLATARCQLYYVAWQPPGDVRASGVRFECTNTTSSGTRNNPRIVKSE